MLYDVVILTDRRYVEPKELNEYISNVLLEDKLVQDELEALGLKVFRTNWDNPDFEYQSAFENYKR